MQDFNFARRLFTLRAKINVSAREMSLAIGQNPAYINNIENGKALPSMTGFFYICDYFKITPADFFQEDFQDPKEINSLIENLRKLTPEQLAAVSLITKDLAKKR